GGVGGALGDFGPELGEISGCVWIAVPYDRRDAGSQSAGGHPVAHRADAEHRHRLVGGRHPFPPCPLAPSAGCYQHRIARPTPLVEALPSPREVLLMAGRPSAALVAPAPSRVVE